MYQDDDLYVSNRRRRRGFLYSSFLLCVLGAALVSAAFNTQSWYKADVSNLDENDDWKGQFHTGLFKGKSTLVGLAPSVFIYHIVCSDGSCMFSCGSTKNAREKHLQQVLDGTLSINNTQQCISEAETTLRQVFSHALTDGGGGGDQGRSGLLRLISSRGVAVDRSGEKDDTAVTEDTGDGGHQGDGGDRGRKNAAVSDSDDSGRAFNILGKADSSAPVSAQLVAAAHRVERLMVPFSGEEQVFPLAWAQDAPWVDVESDDGLSTTDGPTATTPGSGGGPESKENYRTVS